MYIDPVGKFWFPSNLNACTHLCTEQTANELNQYRSAKMLATWGWLQKQISPNRLHFLNGQLYSFKKHIYSLKEKLLALEREWECVCVKVKRQKMLWLESSFMFCQFVFINCSSLNQSLHLSSALLLLFLIYFPSFSECFCIWDTHYGGWWIAMLW